MKKIFFLFVIITSIGLSQNLISFDHAIYKFINRMDNLGLIDNNNFEYPKTRLEIGEQLKKINIQKDKLNTADYLLLNRYLKEFEYEVFGTNKNSLSLTTDNFSPLSEKQKYIFYTSSEKFNLYTNLLYSTTGLFLNQTTPKNNNSAVYGFIGGEIRGSINNSLGFGVRGTNGIVAGNKNVALLDDELKYNWKLNEKPEEKFYDEAQGYFMYQNNWINAGIANNKKEIGYGAIRNILGNNSNSLSNLFFNLYYDFFSFSYFHGKLLGENNIINDSLQGSTNYIKDKFIGYHRLGFDFSKHFKLGLGEVIIYGDRSIDFSYLNPLNFYKTEEHNNQDRDNPLLFIDMENQSFDGLRFYSTIVIDDIDFSKLGTGWWGNKYSISAGFNVIPFYNIVPIELEIQYIQVRPFMFTHRIYNNNYTSNGNSLIGDLQPNSEIFYFGVNNQMLYNLSINANFQIENYGANKYSNSGDLLYNSGGDMNYSLHPAANTNIDFLTGDRYRTYLYGAEINFEPIIGYYLSIKSNYKVVFLNQQLSQKELQTFFTFSIIL